MNPELLGEVVSWEINSTEVSFADVRKALVEAGLNPDEAAEMSPRSAFSRACHELKEQRTIDKVKVDRGEIQFQLTRKMVQGDRIDFDYECQVKLNADSGAIECPENPVIEQQARDLLAFAMQTRKSNDITRIVQRLFKKHADLYSINKRGFAYFVPEQHREFTAKVEVFMTKLGGQLSRFPVPRGTPQGNASVRDAVNSGLEAVLGELKSAVEGFDEETRKSTIEKAMERWEVIRHKVECYGSYLETKQEKLLEELEAAKAALVEKLTAVDEPAKVAA